jgi:putative membrane protein
MVSSKSLEYSIERAVKHYSSLFVLPSYRKIVLFTLALCITGGILTVFLLANVSVAFALQFGFFLFLSSTLSDLVIRQVFMRFDPVYNVRRCAALSMFSVLLVFGFLLVGSLLTRFYSWSFWVDLSLIGFAAMCILRLIVFSSTSVTVHYWKTVGASLTQPVIILLPMFYISYAMGYAFDSNSLVYVLTAIPLSVLTAFVFINSVNKVGAAAFKTPTTTILKAFLANWMEDLNEPLESLFESFGKEKTIDISLLAFRAKSDLESVIVVSSFHPGPFKNVGSSRLPSMIQDSLENALGCVVSVPHGLFGHEFDLASQRQNQKVLESILDSTNFAKFGSNATRLVRTQKGVARASCQIFEDCAVVTLTLAPQTTEDFPQEVGEFILEEASKLGLRHVLIINAHNSINSPFDVSCAVESLKEAGSDALKKASELKPNSFEVGAAKVVPGELSLENGMGQGGISVVALRVDGQTCAYVTIDGNNMVSGLREKTLNALGELGIDAGEVLTTDTHAVNALVMTARGYHPLGELISHEKLIGYVKRAVEEALRDMKLGSAAWYADAVPNVTVIGEKQIEELTLLADRALQRAKKTAVPLFMAAGLLLTALLALL